MTRVLAVLGVVLGIALGGMSDEPAVRPVLVYAGDTVLAADFHVHSFPDGLPPWEVAREARRRRLDAIALTSHNSMIGWRLWTHAPWTPPAARGVVVLPGEELTSAGYHAAVVGLATTIPWRQPIVASAAAARAQGAVAILAHPSGKDLRRVLDDEGLRSLDGVEVAHPAMDYSNETRDDYRRVYERARSLKPRIAAIGSSDFHYFKPLGVCRTYVFARDTSPAGIVAAVRDGRTVACDARGVTSGPPDLSSVVEARCRKDATAPPDGDTIASRAGTALAWAGLLALVIMGPTRPR